MKTQIRVNDVDEELLMRVMEIRSAGKSITTPIRSLNKSIPSAGFNEIYHTIDLLKIDTINSDASEEQKFNNMVRRDLSENKINMFFLSYKGDDIPKEEAIATLADLQYVHSDMGIIPLCPGIIKNYKGDELIQKFILYIKEHKKIIETLNNKTIIGIIPAKLPRQFLPKVLNLYHSHGVTSFVIDSDGSSLYSKSSWIKALQRGLYNLGILEDGFLYNINSLEGKFMKKADVTLARDFVTLSLGMDILGSNHKPMVLPKDRLDPDNRRKGPRVFDPETYGYTREPHLEMKPVKRMNLISQYAESLKIQRVIKEENTAASYLNRKTQFIENGVLDMAREVKSDISKRKRQKSIFDEY